MRKIREVLRLKFEAGLGDRRIAQAIGSARSTVQDCLRRVREAAIPWPLPEGLDEAALHARLYRREAPASRAPASVSARRLQRSSTSKAMGTWTFS